MTASYGIRLLCLCFTCFFLADLAFSVVARLLIPLTLRIAEGKRAANAARLLFALRIFPATGALLAVLGLCLPSYLWLEPAAASERLTLLCVFTALMGGALWMLALLRAGLVLLRSSRYLRDANLERADAAGDEMLVLESAQPVLALAGVFRPQLLVSRAVLAELSPDQLDAALRHERAHRHSGDNLKRLLLLLAPVALPASRAFKVLELHRARYTEWAADDAATGGDSLRSVSLADALLRVSRLKANFAECAQQTLLVSLLVSSLVADDCALSARVERLLNLPTAVESIEDRFHAGYIAAAGLAVFAALVVTMPSTLALVHALLERLLG